MELFPDGTHVRLQASNGRYLHAMEDGLATGLRWSRASLKAAWAVEHVVRGGNTYLLLRSAAYGRYLALRTVNAAPAVRRVCQPILTLRDHDGGRGERNIQWRASMLQEANQRIQLCHRRYGIWHGAAGLRSWVVEIIPPRLFAPNLPEPVQPELPQRVRGRILAPPPAEWRRRIRYVRAQANGSVVRRARLFWFEGTSVWLLRNTLAVRVREGNSENIILCLRAGTHGSLTPLVIDLPKNNDQMDIVVFTTGSPGAEALRYPNVDAH